MGMLSEAMRDESQPETRVFLTLESKIDFIMEELMEMKSNQTKLLTENHVIPRESTEMYIKIGEHIFKGEMELVE